MAFVPRTAFKGKLLLDLTAHKDVLQELPRGAKKRLKRTQKGYDEVENELSTALPQHAEALGLAGSVLQSIQDCSVTINDLKQIKKDLAKANEVVDQTIALYEDQREAKVAMVAETVTSASDRLDPSVAGAFTKTVKYRSQIADKAVATRRKNAEAKAKAKALQGKDEANTIKVEAKDEPKQEPEPG
jgi:hypothetical protein